MLSIPFIMPAAVVQTAPSAESPAPLAAAPRASPQTLATRGPFTVSVILSVTECHLLGGLEPAGSAAGSFSSETCPPSSPRLPRLPRLFSSSHNVHPTWTSCPLPGLGDYEYGCCNRSWRLCADRRVSTNEHDGLLDRMIRLTGFARSFSTAFPN